jgi:hypothetical protein
MKKIAADRNYRMLKRAEPEVIMYRGSPSNKYPDGDHPAVELFSISQSKQHARSVSSAMLYDWREKNRPTARMIVMKLSPDGKYQVMYLEDI